MTEHILAENESLKRKLKAVETWFENELKPRRDIRHADLTALENILHGSASLPSSDETTDKVEK